MRARLLRFLMAAGLAACAAGCGSGASGADESSPGLTTLERAREAGKIRVGFANEAPFAYLETGSGRLTGEAPEIARAVLGRLGVGEVEGVLTEFGTLIPGLLAGRFDIIAAGMYVLPERCRQIAFSDPTYGVGEAFLQRTGHAVPLHGYADVARHPEATLGVVVGAVQSDHASRAGVRPEQLVVFPDVVSAVEGVKAGRADAYAATSLTINHALTKVAQWDVERVADFRQPEGNDGMPARGYGAFGFRHADAQLLDAFNAELRKLLDTPEHLAMVAPFGFTEQERAAGMTAAALCGDASDKGLP